MKKVCVYDTEAVRIEAIMEQYDVGDASVIEALFDIIDDNGIDIGDYM